MHQHGGIRIPGLHLPDAVGLELLVHHATAGPEEHLAAGPAADIGAQVLVRGPENFFVLPGQVADNGQGDARGDHPVGPGLDLGAGIGIDHHGMVGMAVAEPGEQPGRAVEVQGAGGLGVRHENPFFRVEDLGRLAHETDPGHHQGGGGMLGAEAGHLQGIGHMTAGLVGKLLQVVGGVVVGHQDSVLLFEQLFDPLDQGLLLARRILGGLVFGHGPGLLDEVIGNGRGQVQLFPGDCCIHGGFPVR